MADARAVRGVQTTKMSMLVPKGLTMTATRRMVPVTLSTMVHARRSHDGTVAHRDGLSMTLRMKHMILSSLAVRLHSTMPIVNVQVGVNVSVQGTSAAPAAADRSGGHRKVQAKEATMLPNVFTAVVGHRTIAKTHVLIIAMEGSEVGQTRP